MPDLRERYEELLARRTSKKQLHDEQKARVRVLEERAKEILDEAKAYGVSTIKELDALITKEETEISSSLDELEQALKQSIAVGEEIKPTPLQNVTVDDVLRSGSQ